MIIKDNRPENKGNYTFINRVHMKWPESGKSFDGRLFPGDHDIVMHYDQTLISDFLYYYDYDTETALLLGPVFGNRIVRIIVPFRVVAKCAQAVNTFLPTEHESYQKCIDKFKEGDSPHPDELIRMVEEA